MIPTCKHREREWRIRVKLLEVSHLIYVAMEYKLTVMTPSAKLHFYLMIQRCISVLGFLHGCEMLRLAFKIVVGSFLGGEKHAFYCKSLIIVLIKLRLNLAFLDIAYRLGVSVATVSRRFHEILDLITTRLEWFLK